VLDPDAGTGQPDGGGWARRDAGVTVPDGGGWARRDAGVTVPDSGGWARRDAGGSTRDAGHAAPDAAPVCGNGTVEGTEVCDDQDLNGTYGHCTTGCTRPTFPPPRYPSTTTPASWLDNPPACTPTDWLAKYLRYRLRLRGDGTARFPGFLSVGPASGQSIPATMHDPQANCGNNWFVHDAECLEHDLPDAQGLLAWGDATVWLGEYLAVLATEYAAFSAVGLPTAQTREDLYHAIMAYNRVDEEAERVFGVPPARDGFFLRDDVKRDFYLAGDGSYRFKRDDPPNVGYECVTSTYSCGVPTTDDGSFVSQDQVNGLIWGLGLVFKLVPDSVTSHGLVLRQEARGAVHRMVNHLRSNGWRVRDPTGASPPDAWGGNAIGTSYNMAKAANTIAAPDFGITDYEDGASTSTGWGAWQALLTGWNVTHSYNRTMAFRTLPYTDTWDQATMASRAVDDDREVFALAHALVKDVPVDPLIAPWRMEALMTSAPCDGPCFGTPGCNRVMGWAGEHRFVSPRDRAGNHNREVAEYNGIDYMILHNLHLLTQGGTYAFQIPPVPDRQRCGQFKGLESVLTVGPQAGQTYDPFDPCAAADLGRVYCGRTWASWLDQAYRGQVTLYVGGSRWTCAGTAPCTMSPQTMWGGDGTDLILGTPGADDIRGGGGDDCIYGLGGDDELAGQRGRDEIHGGDGNDTLYGEGSGLYTSGEGDVLHGEAGNDQLKGGPGPDELWGGDGDDEIIGDGGDDFAEGGPGNDYLQGDGGDDALFGGPGNDELHGNSGDDYMHGGDGRDKLQGDSGNDALHGDAGDDFLQGDNGDLIQLDPGKDSLVGGDGADRMCGGGDDDTIWGDWSGTDTCRGGNGNDSVNGCPDDSASSSDCGNSAFDNW
jgi:hypothetical protein